MSNQDTVNELCSSIMSSMSRLREIKNNNKDLAVGINYASVGSIINGYREGDISFEVAVDLLCVKDEKNRLELVDDRNWEIDFNHENGNYYSTCVACKKPFLGHKRRVVCHKCYREVT